MTSALKELLVTLSKVGQTHMMDLVRRVNSTYSQVNRNVLILEKEGVIKIQFVGRLRMIRLNQENPKTAVVLRALRMLRNADEMRN